MKLAIYGAGGFGREVAPFARHWLEANNRTESRDDDVIFVSDRSELVGSRVNGIRVMSGDELGKPDLKDRHFIIALADAKTRREIAARCESIGIEFASVVASSHQSYSDVSTGQGAIVCHFTTFTSNVRIGRHFHCNIYSYVAHDCVIGDFVTFAPRVNCNGRVIVEDDVYIGTGATIRHGGERPITIGRGAVVGMGAVVTKDVPPGAVVVGNPARQLQRGVKPA